MKTLLCFLFFIATLQARAESVEWSPSKIRQVLTQAEQDGQTEKLKKILTPEVIETLDWYKDTPDNIPLKSHSQAILPRMAAVAVSGAAVAVVEYLWDKYVGNRKQTYILRPEMFDLNAPPMKTDPRPNPLLPLAKYQVKVGSMDYVGNMNYLGNNDFNKDAFSPAAVVVAEATIGAVAYKAAQYLLDKYGNAIDEGRLADPTYFDLQAQPY